MKQTKFALLFVVPLFIALHCTDKQQADAQSEDTSRQDSIYFSMMIGHLRSQFDDIHDVSMRYHHLDHTLNGLIVLNLTWENGRVRTAGIIENETKNRDFALALIEKIKAWHIEEIKGPFETNLPFRIKIVGSDDPAFSAKSILTGVVLDASDQPVHNAKIEFLAAAGSGDSITACLSNREGIFVRTLIPPGKWHLRCSHKGYRDEFVRNYTFEAGQHHRKTFILTKENNQESQ